MPQDLEQRIRERAYHLWVADGCRDGEADSHWLTAERDVLAELAAAMPAATRNRVPAAVPPASMRPRRQQGRAAARRRSTLKTPPG